MKRPSLDRAAFVIGAAVVMLAGCSATQPSTSAIPGAAPPSAVGGRQPYPARAHSRVWVVPFHNRTPKIVYTTIDPGVPIECIDELSITPGFIRPHGMDRYAWREETFQRARCFFGISQFALVFSEREGVQHNARVAKVKWYHRAFHNPEFQVLAQSGLCLKIEGIENVDIFECSRHRR
jgi:hypothetical protein